jgi:hypothetical protein
LFSLKHYEELLRERDRILEGQKENQSNQAESVGPSDNDSNSNNENSNHVQVVFSSE